MNKLLVPAMMFSLLSAIYIISLKHTQNKLSTPTILAIISLIYFMFTIGYFIHNRHVIHSELSKVNYTIIIVLLIAVVASFVSTLLYHGMLQHSGSSMVTGVTSMTPIFVIVLSYILFGESLTSIQLLGSFVIVGGIYMLTI